MISLENLGRSPVQSPPPDGPQLPMLPRKTRAGLMVTGLRTVGVGFIAVAVVVVAEFVAPFPYKPSTRIGSFGGNQESAHVLTSLDATRAVFAAQQQETARAQGEVIALQASNDRLTRAYEALYTRGSFYAQTWAEGAMHALKEDLHAKIEALKGKSDLSGLEDSLSFVCTLGAIFLQTPDCTAAMANSARNHRDAMSDELIGNFQRRSREISKSLHDWSGGLPDPAEMMVEVGNAQGQILNPAPRQPAPVSPVYPQVETRSVVR